MLPGVRLEICDVLLDTIIVPWSHCELSNDSRGNTVKCCCFLDTQKVALVSSYLLKLRFCAGKLEREVCKMQNYMMKRDPKAWS